MNKKIVSLIIALILPLTFLAGCKNSSKEEKEENFVMTEDTTALDGNVEYNAKTYKDAFFSTENYSKEYLQNEFKRIVKEVTSKEDLNKLLELFNSYSNSKDENLEVIKSTYEKYSNQNPNNDTNSITLDSNAMYEISSRLYKATLNGTKKHYDINDFYIYYKNKLANSTTSTDNKKFENEVKMTAIKEYTIANIYKDAYDDSFISELATSIKKSSTTSEDISQEKENTTATEDKTPTVDNNTSNSKNDLNENTSTSDNSNGNTSTNSNNSSGNTSTNEDNSNGNTSTNGDNSNENTSNSDHLDLTEAVKSQIYNAGVGAAIDFVNEKITTSPSAYCREVYNALENDNPLGDNKEEGYNSFLDGFKTTLQNNNIAFN